MIKWNHWVVFGLGCWLLVSPWLLGFSGFNLVVWNNLLIGALTVIFILWNFSPPEL